MGKAFSLEYGGVNPPGAVRGLEILLEWYVTATDCGNAIREAPAQYKDTFIWLVSDVKRRCGLAMRMGKWLDPNLSRIDVDGCHLG